MNSSRIDVDKRGLRVSLIQHIEYEGKKHGQPSFNSKFDLILIFRYLISIRIKKKRTKKINLAMNSYETKSVNLIFTAIVCGFVKELFRNTNSSQKSFIHEIMCTK